MNKKTVVLGASPKNDRYSNKAVRMLHQHGHDVLALGFEDGNIGEIAIETNWKTIENVDTITLYLNPTRQKQYYDYIINTLPKRIIFNPGTENDELQKLAQSNNILCINACTLVMLSTAQY